MNADAVYRTEAKLDAVALLVATLDRDHDGCAYLIGTLETRDDLVPALTGMTSLAASLAEAGFTDPRTLVAQYAQLVASELELASPPANAEQRRKRRGQR